MKYSYFGRYFQTISISKPIIYYIAFLKMQPKINPKSNYSNFDINIDINIPFTAISKSISISISVPWQFRNQYRYQYPFHGCFETNIDSISIFSENFNIKINSGFETNSFAQLWPGS